MDHVDYLWWIPLLPLCGSAVCGLLHYAIARSRLGQAAGAAGGHGHAATPSASHDAGHAGAADRGHAAPAAGSGALGALAAFVGCAAIGAALGLAVRAFLQLRGLGIEERVLESTAWDWIRFGDFSVTLSMLVDPLSSALILVVTGVGFLIHLYSTGYMKGDPGYAKFFAFLNLFVFAMLMLVLSSNLLGLFVGWEGVGLCSYLLIGFWYQKGWPAEAGQKAFVMNRIGDACFLLGSFLLVRLFGTLDLSDIGSYVPGFFVGPENARGQLALAALLLFGGCCGKSAQVPLFTWLPDAMAGPTPVSALIHAATMVTAGIYLVVRLNPLFAAAPNVLAVISGVGALTALIGASTALVQRDIKKVLAYSTVSQLGYMFLGLGAGAFGSAVFHLITHAFFKGLLFLGAGSVIHGMHEEQDMHRMGGLRKHMPATFLTFLCGAAALSGLPLLSGFFSKDEILTEAFGAGGLYTLFWGVGLVAAAMTAFYTWRMVALTFFGSERFDARHVHPHESPWNMTLPLAVLAVLSVVGGVLGLPPVIGHLVHAPHLLSEWLAPVIEPGERVLRLSHGPHSDVGHTLEWVLLGLGAAIALVMAHRGFWAYRTGPAFDANLAQRQPRLAAFLGDAWGIDSLYARAIVLPVRLVAFATAVVVDQLIIDGLVNGSASLARALGQRSRRLADGNLKSYAVWIGSGAAVLALVWMWNS